MIELRWKTLEIETDEKGFMKISNNAINMRLAPEYGPYNAWMVLQYRRMENIEEIGLHQPIWSEWQDVEIKEES